MTKYIVAWLYGDGNGKVTGHSKPTKYYDTIDEARIGAKRKGKKGEGMWIFRFYESDRTAMAIGQVGKVGPLLSQYYGGYTGWAYKDQKKGELYVLNTDGSLGKKLGRS